MNASVFTPRDKVLLSIIMLGLCMVFLGYSIDWFFGHRKLGEYVATAGEGIAELTGLILLLGYGTLMQTAYWKPLLFSALLVVTGGILLVLHLPYGAHLWLTGMIIVEIIYTIWFVRKTPTVILDWLKYSWICSRCVFSTYALFRYMPKEYELIPLLLFWITMLVFVLTRLKIIGEGKGNY